jgi:hypothetical protein
VCLVTDNEALKSHKAAVTAYHGMRERLQQVPFVSLPDYLFLLRALATEMAAAGPSAIVYVSARPFFSASWGFKLGWQVLGGSRVGFFLAGARDG